jgi:hypothetical protein
MGRTRHRNLVNPIMAAKNPTGTTVTESGEQGEHRRKTGIGEWILGYLYPAMNAGRKHQVAALQEYATVSQHRRQNGELPDDRTIWHSRKLGNDPGMTVRHGIIINSQKDRKSVV